MQRASPDDHSENLTRRDSRIADTILGRTWMANQHHTIGLDAIPDEDEPKQK